MQFFAQYSAAVAHDQLNPEEQLKTEIYAKDGNGKHMVTFLVYA
jgi:hypothetical protein